MRLLTTHSHPSERPGYEARKNAKKVIEGNADTIRRQTIRQNLPRTASVAGGARRKKRNVKTNHRQNPPAYRRRGGGARRRKANRRRTQARRQGKPKSKPSRRLPSWRGGRDKRRKPTQNGKVAQPTVPRGGEVPSRKGISKGKKKNKAKKNNVHHKGKKAKHTVLCYCVSSHITLAAPRLGADEGVGRTTKKNELEKPTVPRLCLAARLPRPWPRTEWGGRRDGRNAYRRAKGTTPGPALGEGAVGQEKYKTH